MNIPTKMLSRVSRIAVAVLLAGCATERTVVEPIPAQTPISEICILENPKVIVKGFLPLVQEGISRHGLRSATYREVPSSCIYVLEYLALSTYLGVPTPGATTLGRATITLYQDRKPIGTVKYVIPSERQIDGVDNPARINSTKEKLDPLMDELFKYFPGKKGS
jgi:hypothetical protein